MPRFPMPPGTLFRQAYALIGVTPLPSAAPPLAPPSRLGDRLTFFRPGAVWPGRYWEEAEGPSRGGDPDPAPAPPEPPLSATERFFYGVFAVLCAFTFLTLLGVVWLAHTPLIAN